MIIDMEYDVRVVRWPGKGEFRASSGLPGYQNADHACLPESGPIPDGIYRVLLSDRGVAVDDGTGGCALEPAWGIQEIPRGLSAGVCEPFWSNWGKNRARMEPADVATKIRCAPVMRGGFYLHDSTKGYSHGCIEVEASIFPILRSLSRSTGRTHVVIKVAYRKGVSTNGNTAI